MDITPGHWIFAGIFFVIFFAVLIWSFWKDKKVNRQQFGRSRWLMLFVGGGIVLLVLIKIVVHRISP